MRERVLASWHWLLTHHTVLLLAAVLVLLPVRMVHQAAWAVLLLLGLVWVVRAGRAAWQTSEQRLFLACFLLLFLPVLLSNLVAVDDFHAARNTVRYLGFLFVGAAVLLHLPDRVLSSPLWWLLLLVPTFWVADALWQYLVGTSFFGHRLHRSQVYPHGIITGVFHPNIRLGIVLAHLLPLYLESLRRLGHGRLRWLWLLLLPYVAVILLSGNRMAWMTMLLALLIYGLYVLFAGRQTARAFLLLAVMAILAGLGVAVMMQWSPGFAARVEQTLYLFRFDFESWDYATSERMRIWSAVVELLREHWLLGLGPRGFTPTAINAGLLERAYLHTHLLVFEIAVATGLPGLLGYLAALITVIVWVIRLMVRRSSAFLPGLALLLLMLPINAHWSFYGTLYTSMFWLLFLIAMVASREARLEAQTGAGVQRAAGHPRSESAS